MSLTYKNADSLIHGAVKNLTCITKNEEKKKIFKKKKILKNLQDMN